MTLQDLVDDVLAETDAAHNPYFTALADGGFAKDDFLETQYQFHEAVTFFARPMAALAARFADAGARALILQNVWEEHGEGDGQKTHGATFRLFLARLAGLSVDDVARELARRPLWPEVRAFNTVLTGACSLDDPLVGAATLGVIERMFSEISSTIGRGVVARGFVSPQELVHYDLHETLDVRHAADFFTVLAPAWDEGPRARDLVEQGVRMGALCFDQLYARLYRARTRRWLP